MLLIFFLIGSIKKQVELERHLALAGAGDVLSLALLNRGKISEARDAEKQSLMEILSYARENNVLSYDLKAFADDLAKEFPLGQESGN